MQMGKGVEWATHICTILPLLQDGEGLSVEALAEFFGLPAPYLAKQLQALRRAGIVESLRGKGGGYRMARPADAVSLLDIVRAIDGPEPAFRCTEIRRNGPCGLAAPECRKPCEIASAFAVAEGAYRQILAGRTIASIMFEAASNVGVDHLENTARWVMQRAGRG